MRIALLHSKLGDDGEARTCATRAAERAPGDPELLNDAASVHVDAGDFDNAAGLYLKCIEVEPTFAKAYFGLSTLRGFDPNAAFDRALAEQMESALEREPADPAFLHFALARLLADFGETDRAFHHWTLGNGLRRNQKPYAPEPDAERVQRLKQAFPEGGFTGGPHAVPDDLLSPIFIAGMPRSGTTLVEQIIGAHPCVAPCGELMLLPHILASRFAGDEGPPAGVDWADIANLYRRHAGGLANGCMRTTDKQTHNFFNIGAIWTAMPDARVILVERNPRDTGLSCFQALLGGGMEFTFDLADIGRFQRLCADICDHWKTIAPARLCVVRYEDLVEDTDAETRRLLEFCGLDWHPDCARYWEQHRRIATASFNQANKPVYRSSAGKWRRYEDHLGPLIEALGDPD